MVHILLDSHRSGIKPGALHSDIDLVLDGRPLARFGAGSSGAPPWLTPDSLQDVHDLAVDLVVIQRAAGQRFGLPDTLSLFERVMIRAMRLMLDGECVYHPIPARFQVTLNGKDDPGLRMVLSGAPHAFRLSSEGPVTILDRELDLPEVVRWHPSMLVVNSSEVEAALDGGGARGMKVQFEATNDAPFAMFMPACWPNPDKPLVPVPWGLRGVEEPAALRALEASEGGDDVDGSALPEAG